MLFVGDDVCWGTCFSKQTKVTVRMASILPCVPGTHGEGWHAPCARRVAPTRQQRGAERSGGEQGEHAGGSYDTVAPVAIGEPGCAFAHLVLRNTHAFRKSVSGSRKRNTGSEWTWTVGIGYELQNSQLLHKLRFSGKYASQGVGKTMPTWPK